MPTVQLPENASLEHLRKQAKLVRQLVASGDEGAFDLLREFHPRFADVSPSTPPAKFNLADAQLTVARLYGHSSWARLREHLGLIDVHTRPDPADVQSTDDESDRFIALACVSYNGDHDPAERIETAHMIYRRNPSFAVSSIAALAVSGDHRRMTQLVNQDPSVIDEPCGPNRWPPLLYCCYSRLVTGDDRSTVATAKVLLDAGADPNAGFLWRGLVPPFTALTGAFGRGEADQPPHPAATDLARALLEAGADPNDGQTLYNNGLAGTAHDDPTHVELLVEFGLGTTANGPWYQRFGGRLTEPAELLYYELEVAAHRGLPNRMRHLVTLGLDLDRPVGRSKRTPWHLATDGGHRDVLAVLAEAGVTGPVGPR